MGSLECAGSLISGPGLYCKPNFIGGSGFSFLGNNGCLFRLVKPFGKGGAMALNMIRTLRTAGHAFPYTGSNLSSRFLCIFSKPGPLLSRPAVPARHIVRFYSSGIDSLPESDPGRISKKDSLIDDDYVSDEELKRRIEKFYAGDVESIPSIFEAILKRKLGGKSEEADEEIMKEIRSRMPDPVDDMDDEEFDSELDELCKTDEEIEDLSDATDSDEDDTERLLCHKPQQQDQRLGRSTPSLINISREEVFKGR